MSNELTIPPVRIKATTTDAPKATPPRPAPVEPQPAAVGTYVNPALRLDAELGLVVIEFRDDSGTLTSTIPSERQIQAYRSHQETPPGREPQPRRDPVASAPPGVAEPNAAPGAEARERSPPPSEPRKPIG